MSPDFHDELEMAFAVFVVCVVVVVASASNTKKLITQMLQKA